MDFFLFDTIEDSMVEVYCFGLCLSPLLDTFWAHPFQYFCKHIHNVMIIFSQLFFGDFNLQSLLNKIDCKLFDWAEVLFDFLDNFFFFELSTPEHSDGIFMLFIGHF